MKLWLCWELLGRVLISLASRVEESSGPLSVGYTVCLIVSTAWNTVVCTNFTPKLAGDSEDFRGHQGQW
jgi:hypothetical protein